MVRTIREPNKKWPTIWKPNAFRKPNFVDHPKSEHVRYSRAPTVVTFFGDRFLGDSNGYCKSIKAVNLVRFSLWSLSTLPNVKTFLYQNHESISYSVNISWSYYPMCFVHYLVFGYSDPVYMGLFFGFQISKPEVKKLEVNPNYIPGKCMAINSKGKPCKGKPTKGKFGFLTT